ncbi:hypothetical protein ACTXG7_27910 [Mycolicibacterium sp. Dal123E01]|uniref:hypothetical protein n=1 Tax=Mycolicibacterium sp. Dal123E01 TaxID=3457578 RepID=UPI00403EA26F
MDHNSHSRPLSRALAVVAAGAIVLSTTALAPPKPTTELTATRISTQAVALAALPAALEIAAQSTAAASAAAASADDAVGDPFQAAINRVLAGAGSGFLLGFFAAGAAALQVFGRIPLLGTPLVQAIAIAGGIIGIPIGAIYGAVSAVQSLLAPPAAGRSTAASRKATATAPHRTPAPGSRKASAPQQRSDHAKAGSARGHAPVSKRAGRH